MMFSEKNWSQRLFLWMPLFIAGLALERLLYEAVFPRWLWLARPFPTLIIALIITVLAALVIRQSSATLPLLLNLLWLFDPTVDPTRSRLIFAASLWLTVVLITQSKWSMVNSQWSIANRFILHPSSFILLGLAPIYLLTLGRTVGRADTFEFQVVAAQLGIAHPTGYPLYLLLGKLWTAVIPIGSVAWRLNVGTAVYALLAATFIYYAGARLVKRPLPALLAALALGVTPTFWSQAVEAEVYTLHALIISAALWLMVGLGDWRLEIRDWRLVGLTFLLGLGLTNHLTTLFLFPSTAIILLIIVYHNRQKSLISNLQSLLKLALAFLIPLSLYAYLPLRWQALNGEPMGWRRFVDWVMGGRFQGALQWGAWLHDPARYEIVGRLFLDNWGGINLALTAVGLIYLIMRQRRAALLLFVTWLGFTFYALNYYVPDLNVFLTGAHVVMALWWAAGAAAIYDLRITIDDWQPIAHRLPITDYRLLITLLFLPILLLAIATWPQVDRSGVDGLVQWGTAVLNLPLAENSAILADSEKIAPLYYLQQAEGLRPDLDIMVLPDEAAYRAELDTRIAAGQAVYLARYLPGLEGIYHLRSMGPLTEVSTRPFTTLPAAAIPVNLSFGPLQLLGYEAVPNSDYAPRMTAVTLYWQAAAPLQQFWYVYLRWQGQPPLNASGQHPANDDYPTLAWRAGEIVPDFYLLPQPISAAPQTLAVQVAVAPPFTPAAALDWQTVTTLDLPATGGLDLARPYRIQLGPATLSGAQFPAQIRPQTPLPVLLMGSGELLAVSNERLATSNQQPVTNNQQPISYEVVFDGMGNGRFPIIVQGEPGQVVCGWLQTGRDACTLGTVEVSGVPLPEGATNFDDKIALLDIAIPDTRLQAGGQLPLTLTWQGLAPLAEDYTVFVQVLDANDRIVGQIDAWPVQGTRPTSQWPPGETITDPYTVQLAPDLPPGEYRLIVGWYLLADLRRLPVLDAAGSPVDDKVIVEGLVRP
ncbi:MAG: DUF2723 domain-containing protein [Ardenticatenaceae bacterium]|nr:DUF2723 domain-containing protein [Anaerolineales bacterium]MCB8921152.1 DUF2723 domain-containing protein [Ardenticatenaceae bacterium]MCB8990857.1 DUF2723 domain-containing protein [Ardenticatenaceae bacterium]MCB9004449.1 DUF2723 domain-containing protein [Ardenticatenaceae bacterium]